jgi:hypothetical protein
MLAIHSSCAKIWLWVTKGRDNIKIIIALSPRYRTCGEWDKISVPQMRQYGSSCGVIYYKIVQEPR